MYLVSVLRLQSSSHDANCLSVLSISEFSFNLSAHSPGLAPTYTLRPMAVSVQTGQRELFPDFEIIQGMQRSLSSKYRVNYKHGSSKFGKCKDPLAGNLCPKPNSTLAKLSWNCFFSTVNHRHLDRNNSHHREKTLNSPSSITNSDLGMPLLLPGISFLHCKRQ